MHFIIASSFKTQDRLPVIQKVWFDDFIHSSHYNGCTVVISGDAVELSPFMATVNATVLYCSPSRFDCYFTTIHIQTFHVPIDISEDEIRKYTKQCPLGMLKTLISLDHVAQNPNLTWIYRMDDDLFVNVPLFHIFWDEEVRFLPEPSSHIVLHGHCCPEQANYLYLQGGGGIFFSWYLAYSVHCMAEEFYRLMRLCDDWEMANWGQIFGLTPAEMGSSHIIGMPGFMYQSLNQSVTLKSYPPCTSSMLKWHDKCYPHNHFVHASNIIFYHLEGKPITDFQKISLKWGGTPLHFDVVRKTLCVLGKNQRTTLPEKRKFCGLSPSRAWESQ